jgi:integrase
MRGKTRERDGVYQRPDRPGFWISFPDAKGKRRRRKVAGAHTLQQARAALAAELQNVERARIYGVTPPSPETFPAVAVRYLKHQKARLTDAGYERTRNVVEGQLTAFFGQSKIGDIRRRDVQRFVTDRRGEVSPGTVARELNILKRFFTLCVEWELIPFSPASGVKSPRVPSGRVRYLHPGELRALLASCPEWLRPVVGLAVSTGMRRGEVLGLRWLDVDRIGERILLPQTKNGEGRIVYLNTLATKVLDAQVNHELKATDPVFGGVTGDQVSMAFKRAARAAKIEDFRFHDLRHTAASWLRMKGADIHTVAQLLGHKDLRMAARYQHLSPSFLSEAVKRLDPVFGESSIPGQSEPQGSCSIVTVASPGHKALEAAAG